MTKKIFISAGDVSGDTHGARLMQEIRALMPDCRIRAFGGRKMQECADVFLANLVDLSAFGFWEPLRLFVRLKKLFNDGVRKNWDEELPDKVILVDYYGFNIHIAKEAHRRGIPVYYYISPQVWATRAGRIHKISRFVTKMLVILPFEEALYRNAGVDAVFVGHPLIENFPERNYVAKRGTGPVIGLFPGSRRNVFTKHMPLLLETARKIREKIPAAEFRVVAVPAVREAYAGLPYPFMGENDLDERAALDLAITTSGTVSLENALLGLPMIVYYRLSKLNYFLARLLIQIPYITMVNILLKEALVPEMIQDDSSADKLAERAVRLLSDEREQAAMRQGFRRVREMLGAPGAARRAAEIIIAG